MPLSPNRSEVVFDDYKEPYTKAQALTEANRCLFCTDAPCIKACPTSIDIPQFIRKIATDNVRGSAKTIFESNIFGMSCARVCPVEVLCVGDCVYNAKGEAPIQIGKLQRYATDQAFEADWTFFEAGPDSGKTVALVGAGPASLACAHELRRFGHRCVVLEKRKEIGGLNTTGVAPYKMKADRAVEEVEWILGIGGIEVRTGVTVGASSEGAVSLEELERAYDAVFVGAGLGADSRLRVPGEDLAGVYGAVAWIEAMKLGHVDTKSVRTCVVVGGGNTALDAVREARGLGIADVVLLYRGDEPNMSGYAHEWEAGKLEGVRGVFRALPIAFEGAPSPAAPGGNSLSRVRCVKLDDQKSPIAGSEFAIDAELALVAIGQSKLGALFENLAGVAIESGRIVTDAGGATGRPKWYAGGDARNGGKEVVNAAAEGKAAARSIHTFLAGGSRA